MIPESIEQTNTLSQGEITSLFILSFELSQGNVNLQMQIFRLYRNIYGKMEFRDKGGLESDVIQKIKKLLLQRIESGNHVRINYTNSGEFRSMLDYLSFDSDIDININTVVTKIIGRDSDYMKKGRPYGDVIDSMGSYNIRSSKYSLLNRIKQGKFSKIQMKFIEAIKSYISD